MGYRGVEVDGAWAFRSWQQRWMADTLKKMTLRRSAIEPTIRHTKVDGRLGRNLPKSALGEAVHVVLLGAAHHLRLQIKHLRHFRAEHRQLVTELIAQICRAHVLASVWAV